MMYQKKRLITRLNLLMCLFICSIPRIAHAWGSTGGLNTIPNSAQLQEQKKGKTEAERLREKALEGYIEHVNTKEATQLVRKGKFSENDAERLLDLICVIDGDMKKVQAAYIHTKEDRRRKDGDNGKPGIIICYEGSENEAMDFLINGLKKLGEQHIKEETKPLNFLLALIDKKRLRVVPDVKAGYNEPDEPGMYMFAKGTSDLKPDSCMSLKQKLINILNASVICCMKPKSK